MIRRYTYEVTFHIDGGALVTQPSFEAKRRELEDLITREWGRVFNMGTLPNHARPMSVQIHEASNGDQTSS